MQICYYAALFLSAIQCVIISNVRSVLFVKPVDSHYMEFSVYDLNSFNTAAKGVEHNYKIKRGTPVLCIYSLNVEDRLLNKFKDNIHRCQQKKLATFGDTYTNYFLDGMAQTSSHSRSVRFVPSATLPASGVISNPRA